ncbi:2-succinyl-6-hydroxy-2, 4-cyclohexadiene-1-carboxylate synthase [Peribacillus simplex]|uniref:2-succinyl-6-hydroxy-2, 4-cyclohexadiene-1-carboxylate synthase n=1 Tax=Peribacillus simplex TaxID=1478 RepID=A0A9W4PHN9_9BACI|nr:2-succinyl-6-hydroxy-2, 4-cyclohexadiene-1-carboxylate synthase [Peribacillus simplex]
MAESSKLADAEFSKEHQPDEMSIVSADQLRLSAKLYENNTQGHKWAIVVHGYTGKNHQMIRWVRNFHENGYNVLAPDLRGHGKKSERDYIGMGWDDRKDMLLWIKQITDKDPQADIALFGISMGGAIVMMTSGERPPSNVKVIVEDCIYSSVWTYSPINLMICSDCQNLQ